MSVCLSVSCQDVNQVKHLVCLFDWDLQDGVE